MTLSTPDRLGHYQEIATDRHGERLWVHRSSAFGIEVMKVQNSDRRWEVLHDSFAVCLVNGPRAMQAQWRYRRKLHRIGVGEMQLMEPGEVHRTTDVSEPASFFVVRWQPTALCEAAVEFDATTNVHFQTNQVAIDALRTALGGLDGGLCSQAGDFELECRIAESTYELLANCGEFKLRVQRAGELHPGLRRARKRLDESYAEKLRLDELAKEAAMARFHFAHAFTNTYGVSPCHYLTMRRVETARSLLQRGRSIAETSALTGFADQAHMTRKFRQILGYTPGAWAAATRASVARAFPAEPSREAGDTTRRHAATRSRRGRTGQGTSNATDE